MPDFVNLSILNVLTEVDGSVFNLTDMDGGFALNRL